MRSYSGGFLGTKPEQNRLLSPGIWTLERASELRSSGLWPSADKQDPAYNNTVLLLHGDGSNNGTVFTDSSPAAMSVTVTGDTITSTAVKKFGTASIYHNYPTVFHLHFNGTSGTVASTNADSSVNAISFSQTNSPLLSSTQSKFGGTSVYFNGSNQAVFTSSAAATAGTDDFTIEFWCNLDPTVTTDAVLCDLGGTSSAASFVVNCAKATGFVSFTAKTGVANPFTITGVTNVRNNTWHNIVIVRQGATTSIYVNGVLDATTTTASIQNYTQSGNFYIGRASSGLSNFEKGYIDEFRFTRGLARYSGNFSVPTEPYPDASALKVPTSLGLAFGTGDFTIECWVYIPVSHSAYIYEGRTASEANTISLLLASNVPSVAINGVNVITGTLTISINTWTHVAISRRNGQTRLYVGGLQSGSTYTDTTNYVAPSSYAFIGSAFDYSNRFRGYIDEFRILKNSGVYVSSFIPSSYAFGDEQIDDAYFNYVTLLLPFNSNFTDFSYASNAVTVGGNTAISTTQSQTGGSSVYFDGSNAYLDLASSHTSNIISSGSGDFTLEFWFLSETNTGDRCLYESYSSSTNLTGLSITNGNLLFYVNAGSGETALITATAPAAGSWYYLTLERISTTINLFIDGGLVGTCASAGLPAFSSGSVRIGSNNNNTKKFQGYIDELKMMDIQAKYRTPFLRPQYANWYPTPTAGTDASFASVCLLYQFNASPITESSTNAFTVTSVGSPVISSATDVNRYSGSSLYLNGSSYLSTPESTATNLGTSCTVEAWVRPASYATTMTICGKWGASGGNAWIFQITNANTISFQIGLNGSAGTLYTATTPFTLIVNSWYHIVAERWSGYTRFFVNGIQAGAVSSFNSWDCSGTGPTYIGSNGGTSQFFNGYIDSIRVTRLVTRYSPTKLSGSTSTSAMLFRPELTFPSS
jgi:hypothetical protein